MFLIPVVPNMFPIPMTDELHYATIFLKIDLKSGYHQIRVIGKVVPKTTFRTHERHYEFLGNALRLKECANYFSSLNERSIPCLSPQIRVVFFDDILFYSRTMEEHVEHLG